MDKSRKKNRGSGDKRRIHLGGIPFYQNREKIFVQLTREGVGGGRIGSIAGMLVGECVAGANRFYLYSKHSPTTEEDGKGELGLKTQGQGPVAAIEKSLGDATGRYR